MDTVTLDPLQAASTRQPGAPTGWRLVQAALLAAAVCLWFALWLAPETALAILWNAIIPAAPALFVVATGFWRNICPLATASLLPGRAGISRRRRLSGAVQARLQLAGVMLLLLIVPLRRVVLDLNGPATAIMLLGATVLAVAAGWFGEWKSAWCAGLCPVLPVETLYGRKPARSVRNTHCISCQGCVVRCPDSLGGSASGRSKYPPEQLACLLMTGGFPGFIAGWMQVPDYSGSEGWKHAVEAWGLPGAGLAVSLAIYLTLRRLVPHHRRALLATLFAASSVIIYYWYRLPALIGFNTAPGGDGMLADLRAALPSWTPAALRAASTGFFLAWFLRRAPSVPWMPRPRAARPV